MSLFSQVKHFQVFLTLKGYHPPIVVDKKFYIFILFHGIGLQVGSLGKGRGKHIYWAERYITTMNLLMAPIA